MPDPLNQFDHIHVHVGSRAEAKQWYEDVLGFAHVEELKSWATERGPLMLGSRDGSVKLAIFPGSPKGNHSTIAFRATGQQFLEWLEHLGTALDQPIRAIDHGLAWSMYFADPWGNPFEITSYDYDWLAVRIKV